MSARITAEPTNANQNGAVTPHHWPEHRRRSPSRRPCHPSRPSGTRCRLGPGTRSAPPAADARRRRAPDRRVRAERRRTWRGRRRGSSSTPSTRWRQRLDDQADARMMLASSPAARSIHSSTSRARHPDRADGRHETEADVTEIQPLLGVEHEHRPGAPRDVERDDRDRQRAQRRGASNQRNPSTICWRGGSSLLDACRAGSRDACHEQRPNPTKTAWAANGQPRPGADSAAPIGGPASWLPVIVPIINRPLPTPEVVLGRRASAGGCWR